MLAKQDRKLTAASEIPLDLQELLAAMTPEARAEEESRREAIARYLSGAEGWREASNLLDGAFTGTAGGSGAEREP